MGVPRPGEVHIFRIDFKGGSPQCGLPGLPGPGGARGRAWPCLAVPGDHWRLLATWRPLATAGDRWQLLVTFATHSNSVPYGASRILDGHLLLVCTCIANEHIVLRVWYTQTIACLSFLCRVSAQLYA